MYPHQSASYIDAYARDFSDRFFPDLCTVCYPIKFLNIHVPALLI